MDVAYIVGPPGSTSNEELRYSLRSIDENLLTVGDAVVYGSVNLKWLKTRQVRPKTYGHTKHADARINLLEACHDPALSDPFWLFNDDFFVMKPMREVPIVHRGEIKHQIAVSHQMKRATDRLLKMGVAAPHYLYECHTPVEVYKKTMLELLETLPDRALVKTIYMNWGHAKGEHVGNAKVYSSTPRVWEDWPLLSTTNGTFASAEVGHFIRDRFPRPSRWEWDQGPGLP